MGLAKTLFCRISANNPEDKTFSFYFTDTYMLLLIFSLNLSKNTIDEALLITINLHSYLKTKLQLAHLKGRQTSYKKIIVYL